MCSSSVMSSGPFSAWSTASCRTARRRSKTKSYTCTQSVSLQGTTLQQSAHTQSYTCTQSVPLQVLFCNRQHIQSYTCTQSVSLQVPFCNSQPDANQFLNNQRSTWTQVPSSCPLGIQHCNCPAVLSQSTTNVHTSLCRISPKMLSLYLREHKH